MNKIVFPGLLLLGLSFTACGTKSTSTPNGGDSTVVSDTAAGVIADTLVEDPQLGLVSLTQSLAEQAKAGNGEAVKAAVAKAQGYMQTLVEQGDTAKLRAYVQQFQSVVAAHKDQITALTKDAPAVQALIQTATQSPDALLELVSKGTAALGAVAGQAGTTAEQVGTAAEQAAKTTVDNAAQAARQKVDAAKTQATEKVNEKVEEAKSKATEKVNQKVDEAAQKAKNALKF